jgi:hypothetical protein
MVNGLNIKSFLNLLVCQVCSQNKQNCQKILTNVITRTKDLLELVHSNMCGSMQTPSWGGAKYFITFTIGKQWLILSNNRVKHFLVSRIIYL